MHLAAVERDAWEHGYKAGHVEGVRKGEAELKVRIAEVDVKIAALQAIIETLAKPLDDLDAGIETELTRLAMIIAKHLVRRELRLDPTQVIGIVRHTVGLLPAVRAQHQGSSASRRRRHRARQARDAGGRARMGAARGSAHGARRLPRDHRQREHRCALRSRRIAAAMRGLLGDDRAERVDAHAARPIRRRRGPGMSGTNAFRADALATWRKSIDMQVARAANLPSPPVEGSLTRMVGLALEASGCQAAVGDVCDLISSDGSRCEAEVVGFSGDKLLMMPTGDVHGLAPSARVIPRQRAGSVRVGPGLLGRIIDGTGAPLDGLGPLNGDERVKLQGQSINPLQRHPIDSPLDVGVRSINSLLTVGRGQRIGLFAGSRRRQERAARHDGALHQRRRHRRRPHRRARPRSEGIRRPHSRARRPPAFRGGGGPGRQSAADPPAWRVARHVHRRIFSRARTVRAADHGFVDAFRAGAARDRPRHRRSAGHARLSAFGVRAPAGAGRARRQRRRPGAARSPRSTPCSPKATTSRIRSPTRRAPFSTATSCCRDASRKRGSTRPSTSKPRSAA